MDELYRDSWDRHLERHRSPYVFRGQCRVSWDLATSLSRLGSCDEMARLEGHLLRNFRKYARANSDRVDTLWDWLALAQHHGLPTRLLDWTYSPFVALHFATIEAQWAHEDALVWCVNHCLTHQHLPVKMRRALNREGSNVFTVDLLTHAAPTLAGLASLSRKDFAIFLEPPSLDARIVNQFALFSLMSKPTTRFDTWLEGRPNLARKIILPAKLKGEVRDKLDQANITERMLFPGLDGLSRWLERYYRPRREPINPEDAERSAAENEQRLRNPRMR